MFSIFILKTFKTGIADRRINNTLLISTDFILYIHKITMIKHLNLFLQIWKETSVFIPIIFPFSLSVVKKFRINWNLSNVEMPVNICFFICCCCWFLCCWWSFACCCWLCQFFVTFTFLHHLRGTLRCHPTKISNALYTMSVLKS